jgi:hypothetical protein
MDYVAVVDDFIVRLHVAARVVQAAIIYVPLAVYQDISLFLLTRHPIEQHVPYEVSLSLCSLFHFLRSRGLRH